MTGMRSTASLTTTKVDPQTIVTASSPSAASRCCRTADTDRSFECGGLSDATWRVRSSGGGQDARSSCPAAGDDSLPRFRQRPDDRVRTRVVRQRNAVAQGRPAAPSQLPMYRPDWPLGSHPAAMSTDADLSPLGLGQIVADFLAALDLDDITLVGNDTGGAICQIVVTEHPERIGRLILAPCDAYENFLPPMFRALQWAARVPALLTAALQALRLQRLRRLPLAYGWREASGGPRGHIRVGASLPRRSRCPTRHRKGAARHLAALHPDRCRKARPLRRPCLDRLGAGGQVLPLDHALRLAGALRDARLEQIHDSYTFVSEDQPDRLADVIRKPGWLRPEAGA